MITNGEYYRKRLDEELRLARAETDIGVRHVHETLASMYRIRLAAEERSVLRIVPDQRR